MDTEGLLSRLQQPVTCHHIEHCCMTAARNGEIFRFQAMRTNPDVKIQDTETQVVQAFLSIALLQYTVSLKCRYFRN